MFMKHVGKHADKKVVIVYRKVPGEDHMCLVVYPDLLQSKVHDSLMKVIESPASQAAAELADILFRNLNSDGQPILQMLHAEGKLKKVRANQIVITPNATSHIKLDELNTLIDGIEDGGEAAEKLAELDRAAGMSGPLNGKPGSALESTPAPILDDSAIAKERLAQSEKMMEEAKALTAESDRLRSEALALDDTLKAEVA